MSEQYQGWTNRETWLVHRHLDEFFMEEMDKKGLTNFNEIKGFIKESVRAFVFAQLPEQRSGGLMIDLLEKSMRRVDLTQLAEYYEWELLHG